MMTLLCPFCGRSSRFEFGIVWMSPEDDDPEFSIFGGNIIFRPAVPRNIQNECEQQSPGNKRRSGRLVRCRLSHEQFLAGKKDLSSVEPGFYLNRSSNAFRETPVFQSHDRDGLLKKGYILGYIHPH